MGCSPTRIGHSRIPFLFRFSGFCVCCRMGSSWTGARPGLVLIVALTAIQSSGLGLEPVAPPPPDAVTGSGRRPDNAFSLDTLRLFADDTVHVFTAPTRWDAGDWLAAAGAGGFALGTTAFDRSIRDSVQAHRSAKLDRFSRAFEHLGSDYSFVVLAGARRRSSSTASPPP